MRRFAAPPVIVMLDLLFIFLFVSVLNSEKSIYIEFADGLFPADMTLFSMDDKGEVTLMGRDESYGFMTYWKCTDYKECMSIHNDENLYFSLSSSTNDLIKDITSMAFVSNKCSKIIIPIINEKGKGIVSSQYLFEQNKCLSEIYGIDNFKKKYFSLTRNTPPS